MSAEFVACMEDILDLYAEPYDPKRPVACFDETSKQLVSEKREPGRDGGRGLIASTSATGPGTCS